MDDAETIYVNARNERAFSNNTDWEIWSYNWCENDCVHDDAYQRDQTNEGCPIVLAALLGRTPREWLPGDPNDSTCGSQYTCIFYRHKDEDDPDPKPLPDPPDIEALFPREICEGPRVFLPVLQVPVRAGGAS